MKNIKFVICLTSIFLSGHVNALAIDNMLYFLDKNGSAKIELINNEENKAFVKVTMARTDIENNSLVDVPLTNENIKSWRLNLSPSKTIMEPKQAKTISLHYNCGEGCKLEKDEIYKLNILPIPYNDNGELTSMKIGFGFAPYVIVPTKDPKPSYEIKFTPDKKGIIFSNTGNTYLNAVIDICKKERNKTCNISHRMFPGRKKTFKLSDNVKKLNSIKFYVVNYDESYKDITILHK
ncbi:hypothetical protein ACVTNF_001473 [Photobacterium damselae]